MKILYGIQGTGNGHISRCRTMAKEFSKRSDQVDYIFSGREADQYFDMEAFGDYKVYKGLTFATKNGKINIRESAKKIRAFRLLKDLNKLDLSEYDCIISDFEPITSWAAHKQGRNCLGISNQAICHYFKPKEYNLMANVIMRYYAPATTPIGLHWHHFGYPLVPPMIDPLHESDNNGKLIVYLPFESIDDIVSFLAPFSNQHDFICFHPAIKSIDTINNITLHPLSRDYFTEVMSGCLGIICNTGFAAISEALILGKKILTKPVDGQFEQIYNGKCLDMLNMATVMPKLDHEKLTEWLKKAKPEPVIYPNVAKELVDWILSGQEEPLESLSNRLWKSTHFPPHIMQRIKALGYAF